MSNFILIPPKPISYPEARTAAEVERLRLEQARSDAFLSLLMARKANGAHPVRVV